MRDSKARRAVVCLRRSGWLLALMALTTQAHATAPSAFTVQGVLRNNAGALQSLAISVTVALYTKATGGSAFATYPSPSSSYPATASNGVFSVAVSDPGILAAISSQPNVWLEVTVVGGPFLAGAGTFPRQQVTSELFALQAASADALSSGAIVPGGQVSGPVAQATSALGYRARP